MKPINIVLLILAGAIGGAVVMKVTQRPAPRLTAVAPVNTAPAAPAPVPAPVAMAPAITPVATAAEDPVKPATVPEPPVVPAAATPVKHTKAAVRPVPVPEKRPSPFRRPPETVASVQHQDPLPSAAPPVAAPEPPAPEPAAPAPAVVESAPPPAPPPPEPVPNKVTLNAGMLIPVRLLDGLSTERNAPGDAFMATLDQELVADGFVIGERGARVEGQVVAVDRGSKGRGGAALTVELTRIRTSDDQTVSIQTDRFEKRSEPNRTRDAEKVAGGAAIGAIIGAIAGGGTGAVIGAGAGGGIGAGDVMLTRQPATLPSETKISFRLRTAVTLTERTR